MCSYLCGTDCKGVLVRVTIEQFAGPAVAGKAGPDDYCAALVLEGTFQFNFDHRSNGVGRLRRHRER